EIWIVQPGDMLGSIARRFGVSVDVLKRWNGLESDRIYVGQSLVIKRPAATLPAAAEPAPPPPPPRLDAPRHRVRPGDPPRRLRPAKTARAIACVPAIPSAGSPSASGRRCPSSSVGTRRSAPIASA